MLTTLNLRNQLQDVYKRQAVKHITEPATKDNKTWLFTVTFEDGTSKDYTVTLGLKE